MNGKQWEAYGPYQGKEELTFNHESYVGPTEHNDSSGPLAVVSGDTDEKSLENARMIAELLNRCPTAPRDTGLTKLWDWWYAHCGELPKEQYYSLGKVFDAIATETAGEKCDGCTGWVEAEIAKKKEEQSNLTSFQLQTEDRGQLSIEIRTLEKVLEKLPTKEKEEVVAP